ncbi:unnamed protein product [Urochloa decumbens]|uniref:F-box domain-containing protein n=1 Tax=Urochloa decumbens TaxID=240449 RepID=A0ABC9CPR9_9POAL
MSGAAEVNEDRISDLPTHLLHDILTRLPGGTAAAARTSTLSRRWRRVWTHLPVLSLDYSRLQPSSAASTPPSRRTPRRRLPSSPASRSSCRRSRSMSQWTAASPRGCASPRSASRGSSGSRCPRLKELVLQFVAFFQRDGDVSIRSGSLERLEISVVQPFDGRLHVDAPKLQIFHPSITADFRVVAPELSEGVQKYEQFLKNTDKVARCNVLLVRFVAKVEHGFKPAMVHLLRKCVGIRRLVVELSYSMNGYPCKLSSGCPCSRFESCTTQSVVLDSLEEVVINDHGEVDHKVELVRLLCRCSTAFHRRVAITVIESGQLHYMRKKIQAICPQNSNVQIAVRATM